MAAKKTLWFDPEVKPVHVGVYQRDYGRTEGLGVVYSHWDGKRWGLFGWNPKDAELSRDCRSSYQSIKWRGLSAPATQATKGE